MTTIRYDMVEQDRVARFSSPDVDRTAVIVRRDALRSKRPPSYQLTLSDGRQIAGELSPIWLQNRACRWIDTGE